MIIDEYSFYGLYILSMHLNPPEKAVWSSMSVQISQVLLWLLNILNITSV